MTMNDLAPDRLDNDSENDDDDNDYSANDGNDEFEKPFSFLSITI